MAGKDLYYNKYLKYKNKYLNLKDQMGGVINGVEAEYYKEFQDVTFPNINDGNEIYTILDYLQYNRNLTTLTFINLPQILNHASFEIFLPILRSISMKRSITHLTLSGNRAENIQLQDNHMDKLARVLQFYSHLQHIDLTNNNITNIGFTQLINGLNDLNFNRIDGLQTFRRNINVDLRGNPIIPRNNPPANNVQLITDLRNNAIGLAGIIAIL